MSLRPTAERSASPSWVGVALICAGLLLTPFGDGMANGAADPAVKVGYSLVAPRAGSLDASVALTSSQPCVVGRDESRRLVVYAEGLDPEGMVVSEAGVNADTSAAIEYGGTWADLLSKVGLTAPPSRMRFDLQCRGSGGAITSMAPTAMTWTRRTAIDDAWTYVASGVPTSTKLSLAVPSPQYAGTRIDLAASVRDGDQRPVDGLVEIYDNGVRVGVATMDTSGTARISDLLLPPGSHALRAQFNGDADRDASVSDAEAFTIDQLYSSTRLTVRGSPQPSAPLRLSAVVTPNNAAGIVTFLDGDTALGNVALSAGTAEWNIPDVSPGQHAFSARFRPLDTVNVVGSASEPVSVEVTGDGDLDPPGGFEAFASVRAQDTNDSGSPALAISIADDGEIPITLDLTESGSWWEGEGDMDRLTVVDGREGSLGWTVSGRVSDFTGPGGEQGSIDAGSLGWTPSIVGTQAPGLEVSPGPVLPPGRGASGGDSSSGLANPRELATSPQGASAGRAEISARLRLVAPTTVAPGRHTALLTLTVI